MQESLTPPGYRVTSLMSMGSLKFTMITVTVLQIFGICILWPLSSEDGRISLRVHFHTKGLLFNCAKQSSFKCVVMVACSHSSGQNFIYVFAMLQTFVAGAANLDIQETLTSMHMRSWFPGVYSLLLY